MATIHISQAEAAGDFAGLMARVRAGTEVVIEAPASPALVLRTPFEPTLRRLSRAFAWPKSTALLPRLDGSFASGLNAVVNSHPEPLANPRD